ncbi:MAG: Hsp20/alpha crystallin family protein [Moraxellaceae bacterium]
MASLMTRHSLFDELFRDFANGIAVRPLHGSPLPTPDKIRIDVHENDDAYTVTADVPGVAKEDIHVTIDGNTVSVQAEVKQHDSQQKGNALHSERYYGAVARSFQLPVDIDADAASAKTDNGVLTLQLPKKKPGNGARRLTVG